VNGCYTQKQVKRQINKIFKLRRLKVRSRKGWAERRGEEGIWKSQKLFKGGGRSFRMGVREGLGRD
jgi:hypothetical protein